MSRTWPRPAPATGLLLAAAGLLVVAVLQPGIPGQRPAYDMLLVVDISQSMLVRDRLDPDGRPQTRLDAARTALLQTVRELPCNSRVGVALFTGWSSAVLFRPVEVCAHRSEIGSVLRKMDWRMTWVPQSNVARGFHDTLAEVADWPDAPAVVFVTDGDEAPPLDAKRPPQLRIERGSVPGVIAGVGATTPSPVPRQSATGRAEGYFESGGEPILSQLETEHLRDLAAAAGLDYVTLSDPAAFSAALRRPAMARDVPTRHGIGWVFAALALIALTARYAALPRLRHLHPVYARRRNP